MTTETKWTNVETYLLMVNLTNDEYYYSEMREYCKRNFVQDDKITYNDVEDFKLFLSSRSYVPGYSIFHICDTWSTREWYRIDFKKILVYLLEYFKDA